jgi:hypothetical protein
MLLHVTGPEEYRDDLSAVAIALRAAGHVVTSVDFTELWPAQALRRGQDATNADGLVFLHGPAARTEHWVELGAALSQGRVIVLLPRANAERNAFLSLPEIHLARDVAEVVALARHAQFNRHRITTRVFSQPP